MSLITGVIVAIAKSPLTIGDVFAVALALIPTGWGVLSVSSTYIHSSGGAIINYVYIFFYLIFLKRGLAT